ncbi:MAG: sensor domain-containing diguanylate cyclase [Proteobacteria bacterium]|nr:sensor domain-containing diguanylate cyclase [Pseudomonadota bacterium]MBU1686121.1 sensor domain-containing diguanylate cyclase [Pseudomonadota bacterium]
MPSCFELKDIFNSLHEGVYCVDLDRKIKFWNKGAERITGYSATEIIGSSCRDNLLVHIDAFGRKLCQTNCPLSSAIDLGENHREELLYLHHKNGHRVPVAVSVSTLRDPKGTVTGAIEVFKDNIALGFGQEYIEDLTKAALFDHLTELPNRRYLEMKLHAAFETMHRHGISFGVMLIDIDHFKKVNDRFGHLTGDRILKMVAGTLQSTTRAYDHVSRWGGEEFLVLINHIRKNDLRSIAEKYRTLIEKSFLTFEGKQLHVTVTIGASQARPEDTPESLLARVDSHLYSGKDGGRNQVFWRD